MDNQLSPEHELNKEEPSLNPGEQRVIYPPKYEKKQQAGNVWIKSIVSLLLYLVLGYYIFPSYQMLLIITAIVIIHEMGHFLGLEHTTIAGSIMNPNYGRNTVVHTLDVDLVAELQDVYGSFYAMNDADPTHTN